MSINYPFVFPMYVDSCLTSGVLKIFALNLMITFSRSRDDVIQDLDGFRHITVLVAGERLRNTGCVF